MNLRCVDIIPPRVYLNGVVGLFVWLLSSRATSNGSMRISPPFELDGPYNTVGKAPEVPLARRVQCACWWVAGDAKAAQNAHVQCVLRDLARSLQRQDICLTTSELAI
jgi:hypothetical protein